MDACMRDRREGVAQRHAYNRVTSNNPGDSVPVGFRR
jgi:hypothetical protein